MAVRRLLCQNRMFENRMGNWRKNYTFSGKYMKEELIGTQRFDRKLKEN